MNPRHSNFSTLITATVFAVVLSLLHVPSVFAGLASAPEGVSVSAGMVSRDAKTIQMARASYTTKKQMVQIRLEYRAEVAQIYGFEDGIVASHVYVALTAPHYFIFISSISIGLRATGVAPKEKDVLLRMSAPLIRGYNIPYTLFAPKRVE